MATKRYDYKQKIIENSADIDQIKKSIAELLGKIESLPHVIEIDMEHIILKHLNDFFHKRRQSKEENKIKSARWTKGQMLLTWVFGMISAIYTIYLILHLLKFL